MIIWVFDVGKATGPVYKVAFRRRRENLTNYAKRLALVKGMKPRMVVRKSSTGILVQFMEFDAKGDVVISSVRSPDLRKFGWAPRCNAPTAYLCALLAGKKAGKKGVSEFNLDIGMQTPTKGSVVFAALKGALDSGLKTNSSDGLIDESRITGEEIGKYAKMLKAESDEKYKKTFASYIKENFQPENIVEKFKSVKIKIISGE